MERAAFAPKERFSDPDQLGSVFVDDGPDINVREAVAATPDADAVGRLEQSAIGYIVTSDPAVIRALDAYEPLKRVALSEAEEAQSVDPLADMTKAQLLDQPEAATIENADRLKVDELRAAVTAEREKGE